MCFRLICRLVASLMLFGVYLTSIVGAAPAITALTAPRQVLVPGQNSQLEVSATGTGTLRYQWYRNNAPIAGAVGNNYIVAGADRASAGAYTVGVTDDGGTTLSAPIYVLVAPATTQVIAWGLSQDARLAVPAGLTDAVALESGAKHSLAIRRTGEVVVWGASDQAQTAVPAGLTNVVAVAGGVFHSLALKSDGTVVGWGSDVAGESTGVSGWTQVIAIAAGYYSSVGLRKDGTILIAGLPGLSANRPAGLTDIIEVSVGVQHVLALRRDRTVVAWNAGAPSGNGEATIPSGLSDVVAVRAGIDSSMAIKGDGSVVRWGAAQSTATDAVPIEADANVAVVDGDILSNHGFVLRADGRVVGWGTNDYAQASFSVGLSPVWDVAVGEGFTAVLRDPASDMPPVFTASPLSTFVAVGEGALFGARASGSGLVTIKWQTAPVGSNVWQDIGSGVATPGGALVRVSFTPANVAQFNGSRYRALASNLKGTVATSEVRLGVLDPAMPRPTTFAAAAYLARYPEVGAGLSGTALLDAAWRHYLDVGVAQGRTDGEFDAAAYLVQYPVLAAILGSDPQTAALHWYAFGRPEGRRVPDGFSVAGYLERHPEYQTRFANDYYGAWLYYRDTGVFEGELYDEEFRPEQYLALYPELLAALGADLGKALVHWIYEGRIEGRLGRIPLEFDAAGYFARNPDVAAAVGNDLILGWQHFWNYGIYEGRAYDDEFRVFEYLALNEDLQAAFLNDWRGATLHWLRYGRTEGRLGRVPEVFNVNYYLNLYPDVATVWGTFQSTVFLHYYFFGVYELRNFNDTFRVADYLTLNPDVAAAVNNDRRAAFMHWVRYGRSEGRPAKL